MRVVDGKAYFVKSKNIDPPSNADGRMDGAVACGCGHIYSYCEEIDQNVAECYGSIVPICPKCEGIPEGACGKP